MSRWRERVRLEDGLRLDLNTLMKKGAIEPGRKVRANITWRRPYSDEMSAPCVLTSDLSHAARGWMGLKLGSLQQCIWLVSEPRHFGGRQWYFVCPRTDKRASVLWKPPGAEEFRCRQGWGRQVAYGSQFLTWHDRACFRARAIRYRLGGSDYAVFEGELPPKPKGMHSRTYEREAARIEALETKCNFYLWQCVARLESR